MSRELSEAVEAASEARAALEAAQAAYDAALKRVTAVKAKERKTGYEGVGRPGKTRNRHTNRHSVT